MLYNKFLMGLQKRLHFVLVKFGGKANYNLSDIWNASNLFEVVKTTSKLRNNMSSWGYGLFAKNEEVRGNDICAISGYSSTSTQGSSQYEGERTPKLYRNPRISNTHLFFTSQLNPFRNRETKVVSFIINNSEKN